MKGGMNAVVWTDFIQSVVLIVLTAYIVWKCLADVSSAEFQSAVRVDAKFFEFDPTKEITFWSAVFGTFFLFYVFFCSAFTPTNKQILQVSVSTRSHRAEQIRSQFNDISRHPIRSNHSEPVFWHGS